MNEVLVRVAVGFCLLIGRQMVMKVHQVYIINVFVMVIVSIVTAAGITDAPCERMKTKEGVSSVRVRGEALQCSGIFRTPLKFV